jgi:hypothetical protein
MIAAPCGAALHPFKSIPTGLPARVAAIGDLNGDGRADLAVGTRSSGDGANDSTVQVFLQDTEGRLAAPDLYRLDFDAAGISIGDLNGDGRNDLAVCGGQGVAVLRQQADGTLGPVRFTPTGLGADGAAIGDLNGDGRADLAVCHSDEAHISVFYQTAHGGLLLPRPYPVPQAGHGEIEIGDITGDGLADLVYRHGLPGGPNFWVLRQDPRTHLLGEPGGYGWGDTRTAHGLTLADLNGDGRTDAAVTWGGYQPTCGVGVFLQSDRGLLQIPGRLRSADLPEAIEAADLNGDGLADLVVAHGGWQNLGTYVQQADGSFSPETLHPLPYSNRYAPQSLAVGDLNGDGATDIALADGLNGVLLLVNAGDADITAPETAILSGPPAYLRETSAVIQFVGLDETTPADGLQFAWGLDDGAWSPYSSSVAASLTGLTEGSHTFIVAARDVAGNVDSTPAVHRFVVDLTPPDSLTVHGFREYTAAEGVTVFASARDNLAASGQLTFAWRVDGGPWSEFSPATKLTLYNLFEGAHLVEVRVSDPAGNATPQPARASFFVDRTPPDTRLVSLRREPTTGHVIAIFAGDDDLTPPNRLMYSWRHGGGEWSPFSPVSEITLPAVTGPGHAIEVRARDAAGNVDPSPARRSL